MDGDFVRFIWNGYEEHLAVSDLTWRIGMEWDFSKYEIEAFQELYIQPPRPEIFEKPEGINFEIKYIPYLGTRYIIATDIANITQRTYFYIHGGQCHEKCSTFRNDFRREEAYILFRVNFDNFIKMYNDDGFIRAIREYGNNPDKYHRFISTLNNRKGLKPEDLIELVQK